MGQMVASKLFVESNKPGEVFLRPQRMEALGKCSKISIAVGSARRTSNLYKNIAIMPLIAPADGANSPGLPGIYPYFYFHRAGDWVRFPVPSFGEGSITETWRTEDWWDALHRERNVNK
jgi:hypothetical protein